MEDHRPLKKMDDEDIVEVEKLGGLAGFGNPGSRLRSRGALHGHQLKTEDRARVDELFAKGHVTNEPPNSVADAFRYRLTLRRKGASGHQVIELPENKLPATLRDCVKDELI
jgi:emfourin